MTVLTLVNKKELLPCPFCGSNDIKILTKFDPYVTCGNCLSFGPSPIETDLEHSKTMTEIISLWNTRYGK